MPKSRTNRRMTRIPVKYVPSIKLSLSIHSNAGEQSVLTVAIEEGTEDKNEAKCKGFPIAFVPAEQPQTISSVNEPPDR